MELIRTIAVLFVVGSMLQVGRANPTTQAAQGYAEPVDAMKSDASPSNVTTFRDADQASAAKHVNADPGRTGVDDYDVWDDSFGSEYYEYYNEECGDYHVFVDGQCMLCTACPAGMYLNTTCHCLNCANGTFAPAFSDYPDSCFPCTNCSVLGRGTRQECRPEADTGCDVSCWDGYYDPEFDRTDKDRPSKCLPTSSRGGLHGRVEALEEREAGGWADKDTGLAVGFGLLALLVGTAVAVIGHRLWKNRELIRAPLRHSILTIIFHKGPEDTNTPKTCDDAPPVITPEAIEMEPLTPTTGGNGAPSSERSPCVLDVEHAEQVFD